MPPPFFISSDLFFLFIQTRLCFVISALDPTLMTIDRLSVFCFRVWVKENLHQTEYRTRRRWRDIKAQLTRRVGEFPCMLQVYLSLKEYSHV